MELKTRKLIKSGAIKLELGDLPKYVDGWTPSGMFSGTIDLSNSSLANNIELPKPNMSYDGGPIINKHRTPITQSIAPKQNFAPITKNGVTDVTPNGVLSSVGNTKPQAESSLKDLAGNIIGSAINMIGTTDKAFRYDKDVNQLIVDAGQVSLNVGGIAYRANREIDARREMEEVKKQNFQNTLGTAASGAALGAGIGSVIPGVGTAIGAVGGALIGGITGLFGSASRKREARRKLEEALKKATAQNNWNSDLALSLAMKQTEAENWYKCGKMPKYDNGKVDSSFGLTNLPKNSYTEKGEWIGRFVPNSIGEPILTAHKVNRGPNDTAPSYVGENDFVLRDREKNGLPSPAKYFEATGDIYGALALNEAGGAVSNNKGKAKIGKMPRFKEGWLPNAIVSGIGGLMGLDQYLSARNQSIYRPNTYAPNTYEGRALPGLASLRYNQYPILNQINNQRAAYDYALNNSGGLSGAQKYLGKIANANNMYRTSADLLTNLQERNIGLKQNYYNTMLNVGAQDAQRRMAANQYDLDYYSKAHAARQQGMQMGMYNMLNQLQQYYANDFKRRQFNDTLSLYREDLDLKKSELASMNKSLQALIDALRKLNEGKGK